jgi:transcriptional regulator with XRE-family HTH domain
MATDFYDNLRALCLSKGITPHKLMKELGISRSAPSAWKGGITPTATTLKKIADYFGVTSQYMLSDNSQDFSPEAKKALDYVKGGDRVLNLLNKSMSSTFCAELEKLCSERGVAASAVASEVGLTPESVTKWKNGTMPPKKIVKKIAEFFGVSLDQFYCDSLRPRGLKPAPDVVFDKFEYEEISFEYRYFEDLYDMAEFFRVILEGRDKTIEQLEKENEGLCERITELKEMLRIQGERIAELKAGKKTVDLADAVVNR